MVKPLSPLARQRAAETVRILARAVQDGEAAISYSELSRRLGMSKTNGQGLATYLNRAAELCAERGWPNVSVLVVSKGSLESGTPLPSSGSFSDGFYASTGLNAADIPAEQERVRAFDWAAADLGSLDDDEVDGS